MCEERCTPETASLQMGSEGILPDESLEGVAGGAPSDLQILGSRSSRDEAMVAGLVSIPLAGPASIDAVFQQEVGGQQ